MVFVFLALGALTTLYAILLNYEPVYQWYTPDLIWLTVAGGNGLILLALLGLCIIGELPMQAFWLAFLLNVTAGVPIIIWQLVAAARRRWVRANRTRRP